jgi:hypothetical protein
MKRRKTKKFPTVIFTHTPFGESYGECLARVLAE